MAVTTTYPLCCKRTISSDAPRRVGPHEDVVKRRLPETERSRCYSPAMSTFRQGIITAFAIGTMLNAWVLFGAAGGYKYYGNVMPLDVGGAEQFAIWIEVALIVIGIIAWCFSRART